MTCPPTRNVLKIYVASLRLKLVGFELPNSCVQNHNIGEGGGGGGGLGLGNGAITLLNTTFCICDRICQNPALPAFHKIEIDIVT